VVSSPDFELIQPLWFGRLLTTPTKKDITKNKINALELCNKSNLVGIEPNYKQDIQGLYITLDKLHSL
jgi:hypothetical protein